MPGPARPDTPGAHRPYRDSASQPFSNAHGPLRVDRAVEPPVRAGAEHVDTVTRARPAREPGQGRPIEVVIAVRQAIKRHGVVSILEANREISVGAVCERVDELFAVLAHRAPQIVLLDAELVAAAGGSLLEACGRLLDQHPDVGLLVVSSGLTETTMLELVRLGVNGHLHYDVSTSELTDAVLAACRGYSALDLRSVGSLVHAVRANANDSGQPLTSQHRTILQLAAEGRSDQEIAKRLIVSVSTVKQQFARIRKVLAAVDRTHAVYLATKRGWI